MSTDTDSAPLPGGVQLTAIDEAFRRDPYPVLNKLRERAPVYDDRELGRLVVTGHDDVKQSLHDRGFYNDPRKANPGTFSREVIAGSAAFAGQEPSMLLMDDPDHRRLRSLVSAPFRPHAIERWRPRIRAIVKSVLDRIEGDEFDLIESFAGPVPTVVIAEMLGVDPTLHEQFKRWSDLLVQVGFNPFPTPEQAEAGGDAIRALEDYLLAEIAQRSANPGEDLLGDMIRAEEEGEKLSAEEIVIQCRLLLVAGNVTTTDLIGNGVKALLQHPEQLAKLRASPELIANAVEEMLRYDSPVTNSARIPDRDVSISGCPVAKGSSLSLSLAAANRDPGIYPDPDVFDIERADTHHQSFGGGRHLCLGAHLARLEAQEAILGLLQRYPNLALSERGLAYHAIPSFRGMARFWVRSGRI
jgi:cytochrome P450